MNYHLLCEATDYLAQVKQALIANGVDGYDAANLIRDSAEAILMDQSSNVPVADVVKSLMKKHECRQDAQRMRDSQRQIEQDQTLARDIQSGKRPGPPINPPGPGDQEKLQELLKGPPKSKVCNWAIMKDGKVIAKFSCEDGLAVPTTALEVLRDIYGPRYQFGADITIKKVS